ncbi:MAG TPA: hypothetical protein VLM41_09280, partial [Steroidobacteraceae bacterium]|nr:hypothetical protein [Steroidobacteraceae bacterium]
MDPAIRSKRHTALWEAANTRVRLPGAEFGPGRLPHLLLLASIATDAFALDATQMRIAEAVDARQPQALEILAETVNVDSATENHAGVRRVAGIYAREFAAIGFET